MTMGERIGVIENEVKNLKESNASEHSEIKETLVKIDSKLDKAIECKADKSEVKDLRDKSWQIISGIFIAMVVALLSLVISLAKK